MLIKTFEAPTMHEALALARQELGEEAVVLNTKYVKPKGIQKLAGRSTVELMAAVDEDRKPTAVGAAVPAPASKPPAPAQTPAGFAARAYAGQAATSPTPTQDAVLTELRDLKAVVQRMAIQTTITPDSPLARHGIDETHIDGALAALAATEDPRALTSALTERLRAFAQPPVLDHRQVIAVVGPTGVGKTTTLAKLAAQFALQQRKKVALVTADTYRIGAVEQLRTYARIMSLPLEVAMSPDEVRTCVEKHADKDVVLIDTVGRSHRSDEHLVELKSFVEPAQPTDTYLVMAASLAGKVQQEAVARFAVLSPTRLVVTKLDESANCASLVNLPLGAGLAVACYTAGQNVPQDISFADAGEMARLVLEAA